MHTDRPLSSAGLAVRITATIAGLALLLTGQFLRADSLFPFGMLSQYSTANDLNGDVKSALLLGTFAGSEKKVELSMSRESIGIERGDLEKHLSAIRADPSLLQPLAENYMRNRPQSGRLETVTLARRITQLKDGRATGEPTVVTLAEWQVK